MNHARKDLLRNSEAHNAARSLPPAGVVVLHDRTRPDELAALRREHHALQAAVAEAAQIQRKLCSPREMRRGSFEIAGELFPVRHLSGDFLKLFDLGAEVGVALGDVAGKGISAGMWVPHLVELSRLYAARQSDPAEVMASINRDVLESVSEPPMVAQFLARLNPVSGELCYCNAGQPAALLLRADGHVETLHVGGPVLGALPEARFQSARVQLEPGDTLIACTDGVVECRNRRDEEYGARRLASAAGLCEDGASASEKLFSLLGMVLDFASGHPLDDDLTLLIAQRRGSKPGRTAA